MGVNKHHEKNSKLKKICIFFCERSLLHKVMLKTISMGLYRNDKKNLERKIDFYPERSFLHKTIPNSVSMGVHRNDNKR